MKSKLQAVYSYRLRLLTVCDLDGKPVDLDIDNLCNYVLAIAPRSKVKPVVQILKAIVVQVGKKTTSEKSESVIEHLLAMNTKEDVQIHNRKTYSPVLVSSFR